MKTSLTMNFKFIDTKKSLDPSWRGQRKLSRESEKMKQRSYTQLRRNRDVSVFVYCIWMEKIFFFLSLYYFFYYIEWLRKWLILLAQTQCEQCGKMVLASRLAIHLKIHSGIKSHLCELCGRAFLLKAYLNAHIRINHRGTERPKRFMCSSCGYTCDQKHKLEVHERVHTDERVINTSIILILIKHLTWKVLLFPF